VPSGNSVAQPTASIALDPAPLLAIASSSALNRPIRSTTEAPIAAPTTTSPADHQSVASSPRTQAPEVRSSAPDHCTSPTAAPTGYQFPVTTDADVRDDEATCAGEHDVSLLINPDHYDSQTTCGSQSQPPQAKQARTPMLFAVGDSRRSSAAGALNGLPGAPNGATVGTVSRAEVWPASPSQTQSPALSQEHYIGIRPTVLQRYANTDATAGPKAGAVPISAVSAHINGGIRTDAAYGTITGRSVSTGANLADPSTVKTSPTSRTMAEVIDLSYSPHKAPSRRTSGHRAVQFAGTNLFSPNSEGNLLTAVRAAVAAGADTSAAKQRLSGEAKSASNANPNKLDSTQGRDSVDRGGIVQGKKRKADNTNVNTAAITTTARGVLSPSKVSRNATAASGAPDHANERTSGLKAGLAERSVENYVPGNFGVPGGNGSRGSTSSSSSSAWKPGGASRASGGPVLGADADNKAALAGAKGSGGADVNDGVANGAPSRGTNNNRNSSSSGGANSSAAGARPPVQSKTIETVRSKTDRAALPGFTCEECARFYETMQQQGIYNLDDTQVRGAILCALVLWQSWGGGGVYGGAVFSVHSPPAEFYPFSVVFASSP
jgi:hypothetical protein